MGLRGLWDYKYCPGDFSASKPHIITPLPHFKMATKSDFEMCFAASTVWCCGSQPKHVRLWFGDVGPNQNTCVCGLVLFPNQKTQKPKNQKNVSNSE